MMNEKRTKFDAGAWGVVEFDHAEREWKMEGRTVGKMDPLLAILFIDLAKRAGLVVEVIKTDEEE